MNPYCSLCRAQRPRASTVRELKAGMDLHQSIELLSITAFSLHRDRAASSCLKDCACLLKYDFKTDDPSNPQLIALVCQAATIICNHISATDQSPSRKVQQAPCLNALILNWCHLLAGEECEKGSANPEALLNAFSIATLRIAETCTLHLLPFYKRAMGNVLMIQEFLQSLPLTPSCAINQKLYLIFSRKGKLKKLPQADSVITTGQRIRRPALAQLVVEKPKFSPLQVRVTWVRVMPKPDGEIPETLSESIKLTTDALNRHHQVLWLRQPDKKAFGPYFGPRLYEWMRTVCLRESGSMLSLEQFPCAYQLATSRLLNLQLYVLAKGSDS